MAEKLKSVSKPQDDGHESAALEVRRVARGSAGPQPASDANREAVKLLVSGKGELPSALGDDDASLFIESVIGTDERTRILATELPPWRMICALRITSGFGLGFVGTGWFVGPRTIVTAGHCVHDSGQGGWASRIEVSPGRDGEEFPFGTVTATRFSTTDRWIENRDPDFDYGCIHLSEPLGHRTGWFGFAVLPQDELEGALVNISGYPGDKFPVGTQQWFHANRVLHVSERRVFYDVDTFGGQSGSPVWIYPDTEPACHAKDTPGEAAPVAIGIHAYGIGGTPTSLGITANSAPRIIPEVFDVIQGWIDADGGSGDGDAEE